MRNNLAPALIGSALLHAALFGFALWKWPSQTREILNAVPVQIVSDLPAMAPAPAAEPTDEETPEAEPVVEETPPEPTPPVPEPPKPTPTKVEPKVDPKAVKKDKTPKKAEEAAVDPLSFVKDLSRSSSKKPPRPPKDEDGAGISDRGPAKVDTGPAVNALSAKLMRLWLPNCGIEGADQVVIKMRFALSSTGRLSQMPKWVNERSDAVSKAAALRAEAAVRKGEPYSDLPELFNQQITVNFKGDEACR